MLKNVKLFRETLTAQLMVLMENVSPQTKEATAIDVVNMTLELLEFHREQGAQNAREGVQEVCVHPDDESLPHHWAEKPFARIGWASVPTDVTNGDRPSYFWSFAEPEHQKGTILADLAELKADVQTLYDAAIDDRVNGQRAPSWDHLSIDPAVIDRIAGAFGLRQK